MNITVGNPLREQSFFQMDLNLRSQKS